MNIFCKYHFHNTAVINIPMKSINAHNTQIDKLPLYQNRGYGNRMVIAKRMRRRRREAREGGLVVSARPRKSQ